MHKNLGSVPKFQTKWGNKNINISLDHLLQKALAETKDYKRGLGDDSVDTVTCSQAWRPEFNNWPQKHLTEGKNQFLQIVF